MKGNKSYFDRIYERRLIMPPNAGFKMRIFVRLYTLSQNAYAKPKSNCDLSDASAAPGRICALEYRAKYTVQRLALLNNVHDSDELRFLDYYSRFNADILRDIDKGYLEFKFARRLLNSALMDICNSLKNKGKENA